MEDEILGFQFKTVCETNSPKSQIPEVRTFCVKGKARLSWNTAALKFTEVVICKCS